MTLRCIDLFAGYCLAGNRRDGMKQVGNCVPPWLARHVIRSAVAQVFA